MQQSHFKKKPSINFAKKDRDFLNLAIENNNSNTDFKGLMVI